MKKFIIQVSVFVLIISLGFTLLLVSSGPKTDPFYVRFTTGQHNSLILGTSRPAQGLQPKVFKEILGKDIFNFSFTVADSPYGPVYLNSIKKKLMPNSKDGLFILEVSPWGISSVSDNPNDSSQFRENKRCLGVTNNITSNPNLEYLLKNLKGAYYKTFITQSHSYLHKDGWYEITVPMDSVSVRQRYDYRLKRYKNYLKKRRYSFSSYRIAYLIKTIEYLKNYGEVYLVRLPISAEFMMIEDEYMPDFTLNIKDAIAKADGWFDLTSMNEKYLYTDSHHLYKKSGTEVSRILGNKILDREKGSSIE